MARSPIHVFTASILGGLHRLGILNQGTVNLLMKTVAPRLIKHMVNGGLLPPLGEPHQPEELVERLLSSLTVGSFTVERRNGVLRVTIRDCNYCPKRIGGASLQGTACPIPRLLIELLNYYGYKPDPQPELHVLRHGCTMVIKLKQ